MADRQPTHPAAGKAASYTRLSNLPTTYDPFSPNNQRRICREAAAREGKELVREFGDLEITARRNVARPEFEQAVRWLLEQKIETLHVAKPDRFSRRGMGHVGTILDRLEEVGGEIVYVKDGIRTSNPATRPVIGFLAEQARAESDAIAYRVREWHEHNRRVGLWKRFRPFGYLVENGKLKPHPVEAPIVRSIVDDFLNGASLRSIAARLNREGVKTARVLMYEEALAQRRRAKMPTSTAWKYYTVRVILESPSLAALISHNRKLVYDSAGDPIRAGEGIVTLAERARILAELQRRNVYVRSASDPARIGKKTGGGRPTKFLLTGFMKCGECLHALGYTNPRRPYYKCSYTLAGKGCKGGGISVADAERAVIRRFTQKLATLEPSDRLLDAIAERWLVQSLPDTEAERKALEESVAAVEQRISDLYDDRYERALFDSSEEVAEWERRLHRAREQRAAIKERLDALGPKPPFDLGFLLETELTREAWERTPLQRRRGLLRLAIKAVLVSYPEGGRRPVEDRVRIIWADEDFPLHPTGGKEDVG